MEKTKVDRKERSSFFVALFAVFLLFLAALVLQSAPMRTYSIVNRTWGFDQFSFYVNGLQLLVGLLLVSFLIPKSNVWFLNIALLISKKFSSVFNDKKARYAIVALCCSLVFYNMQEKYFFLGDFNLRMIQTMKKDFVKEEYLSMFMMYHLATFFSKFKIADESFFRTYSVVMGFIYAYICCLTADVAGRDKSQKLLAGILLICSSIVLLFCGYVEVYSTPAVAMALYLYAGIYFVKNKSSLLWPALAFCVAVAAHLLNASLAPSLLILFLVSKPDAFKTFRPMNLKMQILLVIAFAFTGGAILYIKGHPFLMPLHKDGTKMLLFSFPHLWEYFNGLILCSGPAILIVPVLLYLYVKKSALLSHPAAFTLMAALGPMCLIFISDLQRGSGDWDIMAFSAPPLLLAMCMLLFDNDSISVQLRNYILVFVAGFNLVNAACWIHIHHTNRSIKKIETMLDGDPASYYQARIKGKVQLAMCFKNNQLMNEAESMARRACNEATADDVKACLMVAERLIASGRMDEARDFLEDLLHNRSSAIYEPYVFLIGYYQERNQDAKLLDCLNRMYDAFVKKPGAFVSSTNFNKEHLISLFTGLSKAEEQYGHDEKRLKQMKNLIEQLKVWRGPGK